MAIKRQTQVMVELDKLNGRVVGEVVGSYQSSVISPLVRRIKNAKSVKGLLRQLGAGLLREMDTGNLETALSDVTVQGKLIGRASAKPRMKAESGKRKDEPELKTDD